MNPEEPAAPAGPPPVPLAASPEKPAQSAPPKSPAGAPARKRSKKGPPKAIVEVGRRKRAVARATLRPGSGRVLINSRPLSLWGPELARLRIEEPLKVAAAWNPSKLAEVDIRVRVAGGGYQGQADAARTAIARGLVGKLRDDALREALLAHDRKILVSDHRRKWPKHFGGPGARAKKQKSYR